jgi:RHS repeat-associated protein
VLNNNNVTFYINGVALDTVTGTAGATANTDDNLRIGTTTTSGSSTLTDLFSGLIDQVEVSNTVRSADWIKTEYNNQNSPSTFVTLASVPSYGVANTWDYNNRMTQSVLAGVLTTTFAYDSNGQRIKYTNPTGTSTYYPSKFYNTDGTTAVKHIFANGMEIATVKGTGGSATLHYLHTDHLNGTNLVTDSSNNGEETLDYYPFGNSRFDFSVTSFNEQRKFAGSEYDPDTALNYMNARYYNPAVGRFTSQDPAFIATGDIRTQDQKNQLASLLTDPQQLNSYSYSRNNPLINIDPNGQFSISILPLFSQNTQITIGNWANNLAGSSQTFDYVTTHKWVAYTAGGIGLAAGSTAGVLAGGAALGYTTLANIASYCVFACNQLSKTDYNSAANWVSTKFGADPSSIPSRSEINRVMDKWVNTNMPDKASSILYHFNKHADGGTLSELTQNGLNVWNNYVNNFQSIQQVTDSALKNGQAGIRIDLSNGAGGIFTKAGGIVTTWFK